MSTRTTIPVRSEVPSDDTWDSASIFETPADWEAEYGAVAELLPGLAEFRGHLADGPGALLDWFVASEEAARRFGRLGVYATMGSAVDAGDQVASDRSERSRALGTRLTAATAFAQPELLRIGPERLDLWLAEEPRLRIYRHALDQIERARSHVRSEEVEELLAQAGDALSAAGSAHSILANAELRFAPATDSSGVEFELAQGTINLLLTSPDRELRRSAWTHYADAHLAYRNTMATSLAGGVKRDVLSACAHNYSSCLEAALAPNEIPLAAFRNVIDSFRANLPTWHRYWEVRASILGLDRLEPFDMRAHLTEKEVSVPFSQAVKWVADGMSPLGEEYVSTLRRGVLDQRWVDIYPNRGKRMGAFSISSPGTRPFIFMSYNDDVLGVSTLAHELGHSMHSHLSDLRQPFVYSHYSLFVAEVASNFNQALVRSHLLSLDPSREFQIAVIEEAMSNFHRYFLIMPTLARFELEIHERVERGEALTADSLIDLMADLLGEAYGPGVVMDRTRVGITWAQFHTHLYSNFYVYQYATGIAGAQALADRVLSGAPGSVERYLEFLSAGGSVYPLDALRRAGVDMASPAPIEQAFRGLSALVDRLAGF